MKVSFKKHRCKRPVGRLIIFIEERFESDYVLCNSYSTADAIAVTFRSPLRLSFIYLNADSSKVCEFSQMNSFIREETTTRGLTIVVSSSIDSKIIGLMVMYQGILIVLSIVLLLY